MKSILIVDDYQMMRASIKAILQGSGDYELFEASNGYEAVAYVDVHNIDVVLMDLDMPEKDGLEATKEIVEKFPETKILVLTAHFSKEWVLKLLGAGAVGYVLKDIEQNELEVAIDTVLNGGYYFGNKPMEVIMQDFKQDFLAKKNGEPHVEHLSEREVEIIQCAAEGLTNKEIGSKLFLSKRTIDTHRQNIMDKLNVKNSAQLIYFAVKNHLI